MPSHTAYIALGSNLGDRRAHILAARDRIARLPATSAVRLSPVYETAPVGPVEQGPFLNAAAQITTRLDPFDLLRRLRDIEDRAGRQRTERWGPRTLDLDLLLYQGRVIDTPDLTLPHPRMHERDFVLRPLADLAPDTEHPTLHRTIQQLLDDLQGSAG